MKAVKIGGYALLALIGLFLLLGLIAPRHAFIKRSLVIDASPESVYAVLNDLSSFDAWSPWKERDSTIKTVLGNPSSGKGAYYTWTSENSGEGKMDILDTWPNDSIHMALSFSGMSPSKVNYYLEKVPGGTRVDWTMAADFAYPFNAMMLFMSFEKNLTADYDRGLVLLKEYMATKTPATPAYEIKEIDYPGQHFLAARSTLSIKDIPAFFQTKMPALGQAVETQKISQTGAPCGLFYVWDEAAQKSDMAVAIPTPAGSSIKDYSSIDLPAGRALVIEYYGAYEGTGAAHYAMDEYAKAKNLTIDVPVLEEYVTDPMQEPDTAKWLTRVIYRIKK